MTSSRELGAALLPPALAAPPQGRGGFALRPLPVRWLAGVAAHDPAPSPPRARAGPAAAAGPRAGPAAAGPRATYANRPAVLPEEDGLRLGGTPLSAVEAGAVLSRGRWSARGALRMLSPSEGPVRGSVQEASLARLGERHGLLIGRSPRRWGGSAQGSLLLGRSAPPLWQASWATRRALAVPLVPALGTWTGESFLAYLDDEARVVPHPLLTGHRLGWQPASWLEIAGARTILFGGRGRTRRLTLGDLGNIFLGRRENLEVGERGRPDSDQRAAFELRGVLPPRVAGRLGLDGAEVVYEYAGEDMIDPPLPAAVGHLVAASAARSGWTARLEFAETVSRNRWYDRHVVYGDAHFYRGFPLGMSFGPDVESSWLALWSPPGPFRVRLDAGRQLLGQITGRRERRASGGALLRWSAERWTWEAEVRFGDRTGRGREPLAPPLIRRSAVLRLQVG